MKKSLILLSAVCALALTSCTKKESSDVIIGGIFPLSGNVAVYGVECKNGVDLASSSSLSSPPATSLSLKFTKIEK